MKAINVFFFLWIALTVQAQNLEIYVSDAGNFDQPPWQIVKWDGNGQNPSVFIDSELNWPQDILFMESENEVLISNLGSGCINRHHISSGNFKAPFACGIGGPTRMKIGPDSLLYVLQWSGNGKVLSYKLDGTFVGEFTKTGVPQSIGLDWDVAGNLYVSSYNGDYVKQFDQDGNEMGTFIANNLAGPTNIWFDENGDLLVSDYDGTEVKRFNSEGEYQGDFLTGLSKSEGVDYLPNGNILMGNGASSSVKMFDANGNYIKDLISPGSAGLKTPNAVRVRELPVASIGDGPTVHPQFVIPHFEAGFRFHQHSVGLIQSFTLHGLSGKKIASVTRVQPNMVFGANLPVGVYLVVLQLKNGQLIVERIVVEK